MTEKLMVWILKEVGRSYSYIYKKKNEKKIYIYIIKHLKKIIAK